MLSYDAEHDRSAPIAPFSNGFEGESWESAWCESGCRYADACPLMLVALMGRMPAPWTETNPRGLTDRYACAEYTPTPTTPCALTCYACGKVFPRDATDGCPWCEPATLLPG